MAAMEAGKKRQALAAASVTSGGSTSASSGSGKRDRGQVAPTRSTKVTPDAKVPCVATGKPPVEPRALTFEEVRRSLAYV